VEQVGDDGAGGPHRFVDEQDGLLGIQGPETMVVDDLGDGNQLGAGHGLGHLVVVDEHEASRRGLSTSRLPSTPSSLPSSSTTIRAPRLVVLNSGAHRRCARRR